MKLAEMMVNDLLVRSFDGLRRPLPACSEPSDKKENTGKVNNNSREYYGKSYCAARWRLMKRKENRLATCMNSQKNGDTLLIRTS